MIEVQDFRPEHLERFTPRPWDVEAYAGQRWDEIQKVILDSQKHGPAWVAIDDDGSVLVITGFVVLWPGVAEGWGFFSDGAFKRPKEILGHYRRWIQAVMETWELWRLQVMACCSLYGADRWAKAMGFQFEGCMRKWGAAGEDYSRFALVR